MIEFGWNCNHQPSECIKIFGGGSGSIVCGNGIIEEPEECDDGYRFPNDGCDEIC